MQYVYNVCIIDFFWVVDVSMFVIMCFQFCYVLFCQFQYFFFGVEVDSFGWIGYYISWFLVDVDVIDVECVFIYLVIFFVEVWNIKWIFGNVVIIVDVVF